MTTRPAMSRFSAILSLVLGVIIVALAACAWHLHQRLTAAETTLAARAGKESQSTPPSAGSAASRPAGGAAPANDAHPAPSNQRTDDSSRAYRSPEGRRLMVLQYKGNLDRAYAALFKQLNLTPADLEKLKNLLAERNVTEMASSITGLTAGLDPRNDREQIQKLVSDRVAEINASIRALLGETEYQRYRQYDQTQSQRNWVTMLEQRLSFSSAPLYGNQPDQLVNLLAAAAPDQKVPDTESILTRSAGFLSPPQIEELRQMLQEQVALAELREQVQQQRRAGSGATPTPPPAAGTGG